MAKVGDERRTLTASIFRQRSALFGADHQIFGAILALWQKWEI
jgi:hypothetical protein